MISTACPAARAGCTKACLAVPDGRAALVIYWKAACIDTDPLLAERTAEMFAALARSDPPDPSTLIPTLDGKQRTVLRITPD